MLPKLLPLFRPILACLVGLLVAMTAGRAQAQLTADQKQEMRQHYEKATRAYDIEKYGEAVDEYQKAYEIGGDPAMLYNIAQAYRLNKQLPDALHFYRRYLQRSPNARNREDVERKIAEVEKTVEERRKAAAAATPPPLPAPPVATTPAPTPTPAPVGPPAPTNGPTTTPSTALGTETPGVTATAPPVEEGSGRTLKIVGWSSVGVGVLCGAGALITGLMARSKGQDLTNMSNAGLVFDPNVEHSGKVLNNVTIGLGIAGGVFAVAGAVLVVVGSSGSGESAAPAPEGTTPPAPSSPSAMVAPWIGSGLVGAGAAFRF